MSNHFKPDSANSAPNANESRTGATSLDSTKDQAPKHKAEVDKEAMSEQDRKHLESSAPEV